MTEHEEGSRGDYWDSVKSMAEEIFEACDEDSEPIAGSTRLHEEVDGTAWVIYYGKALDVLKYSDHDDAIFEEMGDDALHGCKSMGDVYSRAAYYAMMQDIIAEAENNLPDPTITYTLQWKWTLEDWPEEEEEALDTEEEEDEEDFNTLSQAREAAQKKREELDELLAARRWTSVEDEITIVDSEGDEHDVKAPQPGGR
jgi:hypothetical protein